MLEEKRGCNCTTQLCNSKTVGDARGLKWRDCGLARLAGFRRELVLRRHSADPAVTSVVGSSPAGLVFVYAGLGRRQYHVIVADWREECHSVVEQKRGGRGRGRGKRSRRSTHTMARPRGGRPFFFPLRTVGGVCRRTAFSLARIFALASTPNEPADASAPLRFGQVSLSKTLAYCVLLGEAFLDALNPTWASTRRPVQAAARNPPCLLMGKSACMTDAHA